MGKSGNCGLPSTKVRLQRRAISSVLATALGTSANSEILLAGEAAHPARVGQHVAVGNAHAGLVGLVVVWHQKLRRVCGHHGQAQARGQGHGGAHQALVVGAASALQFQIKTVGEHPGGLQGHVGGFALVTGQQGHAHRPGGCAADQNEPLVQLL